MEKFKVMNIEFYFNGSLLNEEQIKGVLELTEGRYKELDLEVYLYQSNGLEHVKFILDKVGALQVFRCLVKKIYGLENDGFDNYYSNSNYMNIFVYKHKRILKKQVKYKVKRLVGKLNNEEDVVEYFTNNFLRFKIIYRIILMLELARIKKFKHINIDNKRTSRYLEDVEDSQLAFKNVDKIVKENIKEILEIIESEGIEMKVLANGELDFNYKIYKPLLERIK